MTTDPIAAAIDHIRSVTPADNPWTADDVSSFSPWEPDESDHAIATILNAVVSGQLINRHSRDEMLAQVRRGKGFSTAGAEARWIADSDAGVYDADAPDPIAAARAMIEPLTGYTPGPWRDWKTGYVSGPEQGEDGDFDLADVRLIAAAPDLRDMVATLADALDAERAKVAAAFKAGVKRGIAHAAGHTCEDEGCPHYGTRHTHPGGLEAPADAQAALDKLLDEARLEGWRAGRDAAAESAHEYAAECLEKSEDSRYDERFETASYFEIRAETAEYITHTIRALPEPKEASHDD